MTASSGSASPKGVDPHAHVPALSRIFETLGETELRKLMLAVSSRAGFELPGATVSPAKLAFDAAMLVANHGALDTDLIRELRELRPRRHFEIEALAKAAGISWPAVEQDQATLKPPSPPPPADEQPPPRENPAAKVPAQPPSEAPQQRRAAVLYAALSAALFVTILVVSPERLPSYKLAMVAVISAVMAGFLSMLLTGQILVRLTGNPRRWHPAVEASGGLAVVVFVLAWWPRPALQPEPPAATRPDTGDAKAEALPKPDSTPSGGVKEAEPDATPPGGAKTTEPAAQQPAPREKKSTRVGKLSPPQRWTIRTVEDKRLKLAGDPLPPSGLLRLVPPGDARAFVSAVECRIEDAPMTCMLVVKPGNARPMVGDQLESVTEPR